jgi:hypothetical protein
MALALAFSVCVRCNNWHRGLQAARFLPVLGAQRISTVYFACIPPSFFLAADLFS